MPCLHVLGGFELDIFWRAGKLCVSAIVGRYAVGFEVWEEVGHKNGRVVSI